MFDLYCATAIGPSNYVDDHASVCQDNETPFFYPRRACAARVTVVGLSVCVCVCVRLFWHYRLRGGLLAAPAASKLREPEK